MIEDDPVLGAFVAVHPSERLRPLLIAGGLCGVVGLVLTFTLASSATWWGPPLSLTIMAVVALGVGWYVLHGWNREVILFSRGFTYREGSRVIPFRYSEIEAIRERAEQRAYFGGLLRRAVYRVTLTTVRGESIVLTNSYRRIDELTARVEKLVYRDLKPRLLARLEAGAAVPFGDRLRLTADGWQDGERALPWGAFGGYRVAERRLTLLDAGGQAWFSASLATIDNVALLIDLLRERQAARETDAAL